MAVWRCWRTPPLRRPLALGIAVGLLAWQFAGGGALQLAARHPDMPALTLAVLDGGGNTTLTAAAQGKPAVVNLWASWCPPCRREMPVLVDAQLNRKDIAFVFVNQGEAAADAAQFVASVPSLHNVLLDPQTQLGRAVGSSAMPTTLFYGIDGKLVDMQIGALSTATLAAKLDKLNAAH